jgi:hypothetical protein
MLFGPGDAFLRHGDLPKAFGMPHLADHAQSTVQLSAYLQKGRRNDGQGQQKGSAEGRQEYYLSLRSLGVQLPSKLLGRFPQRR